MKAKVYKTVVVSALLHNSKTWIIKEEKRKEQRIMAKFVGMACLQKIEVVTRREEIRNEKIRERAVKQSMAE